MNLNGTIGKIISYAVSVTEPEEIILFGSMVDGRANVFSDIDMLIICESGIAKKEAVSKISHYANQFSLKTDVLIYSLLEFKKELNIENSFLAAVQKSGKIIYKKMQK